MPPASSPARRLAVATALLTVALLSCGKEATTPVQAPPNAFHRFGAFAFITEYESAV
jgi:hypothetical protein